MPLGNTSSNDYGTALLATMYRRVFDRRCNRYYYAILECDTSNTASHIFNELDGTELEQSANVFDMSFVPDEMPFDQEFR